LSVIQGVTVKNAFIRIAFGAFLTYLAVPSAQAQSDRISGRIDDSRTVAVPAAMHGATDDQGAVDPAMEISYATLYLKPTPAQQADLAKLLVDQQSPLSPTFHRWLTSEQYADRFGLSRSDISKITSWPQSQGLKVNDVARGRHWNAFTGSAA
jgi:hypothetical protein